MAERLRRLEQVYERCPIYFLTAGTFERRALLANTRVHEAFVGFAEKAAERGAWVGKYVLMPDHLHLFLVVDDTRIRLSAWVKSLKNVLSKVLRVEGIDAPHWQKGFFDHVLRGSESYAQKWIYVRDNPV
jgi:putative transposase